VSGQGGEVWARRRTPSLIVTSPPGARFARATLPMKGTESAGALTFGGAHAPFRAS
jgi:hypothetical protein